MAKQLAGTWRKLIDTLHGEPVIDDGVIPMFPPPI